MSCTRTLINLRGFGLWAKAEGIPLSAKDICEMVQCDEALLYNPAAQSTLGLEISRIFRKRAAPPLFDGRFEERSWRFKV